MPKACFVSSYYVFVEIYMHSHKKCAVYGMYFGTTPQTRHLLALCLFRCFHFHSVSYTRCIGTRINGDDAHCAHFARLHPDRDADLHAALRETRAVEQRVASLQVAKSERGPRERRHPVH